MKLVKYGSAACISASAFYLFRKRELPIAEGEPYRKLPVPRYEEHPNRHFLTKVPRTVGVIGSGVGGLCTAKELLQQGYEVEVFEKNAGLGGTWFNHYENAGLQGPWFHYHFPDYLLPDGVEVFPKLPVLKTWLEDYSRHFNVDQRISYNCEVKTLHQREDGTWDIHFTNGETKNFDFLVLASGRFHTPHIPQLEGGDLFKGQIVHSSQVYDAQALFKDKRVVIVGGSRSGQDIGALATTHASQTTMIARTIHYSAMAGNKFLGLPVVFWVVNKISQACSPPWDNNETKLIYSYFTPLCSLYQYFLRWLQRDCPEELRCTLEMKKDLPIQVFAASVPFVEAVKQKKARVIKGSPTKFTEHGVVVNGEEIRADVVVMCTGFEQQWLGLDVPEKDYLYRTVLIPQLKNFAVVGCFSVISAPMLINMQVVWIAEMLRGAVKLPSQQQMELELETRKKRFEEVFDKTPILGHGWTAREEVVTMLLKDMGINPLRKERVFQQWLLSTMPLDYKTVVTHRV